MPPYAAPSLDRQRYRQKPFIFLYEGGLVEFCHWVVTKAPLNTFKNKRKLNSIFSCCKLGSPPELYWNMKNRHNESTQKCTFMSLQMVQNRESACVYFLSHYFTSLPSLSGLGTHSGFMCCAFPWTYIKFYNLWQGLPSFPLRVWCLEIKREKLCRSPPSLKWNLLESPKDTLASACGHCVWMSLTSDWSSHATSLERLHHPAWPSGPVSLWTSGELLLSSVSSFLLLPQSVPQFADQDQARKGSRSYQKEWTERKEIGKVSMKAKSKAGDIWRDHFGRWSHSWVP